MGYQFISLRNVVYPPINKKYLKKIYDEGEDDDIPICVPLDLSHKEVE